MAKTIGYSDYETFIEKESLHDFALGEHAESTNLLYNEKNNMTCLTTGNDSIYHNPKTSPSEFQLIHFNTLKNSDFKIVKNCDIHISASPHNINIVRTERYFFNLLERKIILKSIPLDYTVGMIKTNDHPRVIIRRKKILYFIF